jgi:hypothetical protein
LHSRAKIETSPATVNAALWAARGALICSRNKARQRNVRLANEASDDGTAAASVPAAGNREDKRQIANARV